MPVYYVDPQGEIVKQYAAEQPVVMHADLTAMGYQRIDNPGTYDKDHFAYDFDLKLFVAKPDPTAAELLAAAASAKKLELANLAQAFIATLGTDELEAAQAVDPSRTYERYPSYWIQWAGGQNDLAQLISVHADATAEQIARAEAVKLAYWHVQYWISLVTSEPVEAAYVALETAVAAGDIEAVKAVSLDLAAYKIGADGDKADPDKTRLDLYLPPQHIVLLAPTAV